MMIKPVLLWSDILLGILLMACFSSAWLAMRKPQLLQAWRKVGQSSAGVISACVLAVFVLIGLLDSLHYREALPPNPANPAAETQYSVEVISVLDAMLKTQKTRTEKTYSAPLATHLFAKESLNEEGGARDYPRLKYGGQHLPNPAQDYAADIGMRLFYGLLAGGGITALLWFAAVKLRARYPAYAWRSAAITLGVLAVLASLSIAYASVYHLFGTDKVGQDVLYLSLKSVRTALLIGTLTTLSMLPAAIAMGIVAGYVGGWVDDVIQYIYTVLNSIPGVLLIAAAVLMMQVVIDTHPSWFSTAAERADARLLALCFIMGMTSWTGLCRLLRAETLKLRELEFVQAARAFGVRPWAIMARHILPNVMHIVLIAIVMDFSGLVLAEAVLSYIGVGVDQTMISFGGMINMARMELAREPMVWWSLTSAFVFMFVLVLAANLFADAVRDAFDPRGNHA